MKDFPGQRVPSKIFRQITWVKCFVTENLPYDTVRSLAVIWKCFVLNNEIVLYVLAVAYVSITFVSSTFELFYSNDYHWTYRV